MPYKTEVNYDAEHKIWSGKPFRNFFAPDLSLGEIIFHEMRRRPNLIAQVSVSENTVLTIREMLQNSMRVASYMRSLGINQSENVGIMARNTTHIAAVAYGCLFNGIPFHAVNINSEEEVIRKLYALSKPRIIFCDGDEYAKIKAATSDLNTTIVTMRNHPGEAITIREILATPVEEGFKPHPLEEGSKHTLAILSSSGTTGTPKLIPISNIRGIFDISKRTLTIDDVLFTNASLDWLSGFSWTIISGAHSCKRIITDRDFQPTEFLSIIEEHKVTLLTQGPAYLAMMVHCPKFEKTNFDSIRIYFIGGDRCSAEVQQRLRSRLKNGSVVFAYGTSETGVATRNFYLEKKPNSVGFVGEGYKLKVLNEHGEALGPNQMGEVYVYSDLYWAGYYGNIEETRKARDSENWFATGDLGYVDEDGFLYIVNRKKDLLKYQSHAYLPSDIEQVISRMPGVAEVCVFGIWDQFQDDAAAAAVVKMDGYEISAYDVVNYVQQNIKNIHKHLHGGALIVDHIKYNPNGKTNRSATKAYFMEIMASKM